MVEAGLAIQFGIIVATIVGLWIGARTFVDAVVRLAHRFGVTELTIGLTIVAIGTSMPELVVTADAAAGGLGDIAVGNVIGSNIYNLAFILGAVSILRIIPVERSLVHRDGIALLLATLIGSTVPLDRHVSRVEGIVLAGLFALYTIYLIRDERDDVSIETEYVESPLSVVAHRVEVPARDGGLVVLGLGLVLLSGHVIVDSAAAIAGTVGISDWVIGGTIAAAGTSTPEFAVSVVAMGQGYIGMSVGNVVGSNIFNILGILGVVAAIRPLTLVSPATESLLWLVVLTGIMVGALWSGRKLSRIEGGLFLLSELVRLVLGLSRVLGWSGAPIGARGSVADGRSGTLFGRTERRTT